MIELQKLKKKYLALRFLATKALRENFHCLKVKAHQFTCGWKCSLCDGNALLETNPRKDVHSLNKPRLLFSFAKGRLLSKYF